MYAIGVHLEVQVGTCRASGITNLTDFLTGFNHFSFTDQNLRQMHVRGENSHTMVNDDGVATDDLVWLHGHDRTLGRRIYINAHAVSQVQTRMEIEFGLVVVIGAAVTKLICYADRFIGWAAPKSAPLLHCCRFGDNIAKDL